MINSIRFKIFAKLNKKTTIEFIVVFFILILIFYTDKFAFCPFGKP